MKNMYSAKVAFALATAALLSACGEPPSTPEQRAQRDAQGAALLKQNGFDIVGVQSRSGGHYDACYTLRKPSNEKYTYTGCVRQYEREARIISLDTLEKFPAVK